MTITFFRSRLSSTMTNWNLFVGYDLSLSVVIEYVRKSYSMSIDLRNCCFPFALLNTRLWLPCSVTLFLLIAYGSGLDFISFHYILKFSSSSSSSSWLDVSFSQSHQRLPVHQFILPSLPFMNVILLNQITNCIPIFLQISFDYVSFWKIIAIFYKNYIIWNSYSIKIKKICFIIIILQYDNIICEINW